MPFQAFNFLGGKRKKKRDPLVALHRIFGAVSDYLPGANKIEGRSQGTSNQKMGSGWALLFFLFFGWVDGPLHFFSFSIMLSFALVPTDVPEIGSTIKKT